MHQLLARTVLVPFTVTLDDFEQLLGCLRAIATGVERGRQIESRLMIERVCGDFLFQFGDRPNRLCLLGEIERSLHGLDRRVIAFGLRHQRERLLGLLDRAGRDVAFREPRQRRDVGGIDRQHFGIDLRRTGGIALGQHGVGFPEDLGDVGLAGVRHARGQFIDEGGDLALRHRAHEAVGGLAVDEGDHSRNRLDAHLARDRRMLVDVHLDQLDLAARGANRLFDDRGELAAGAAPRRPEVDQHRLALRFLDHVLDERLGGGFLDQLGRRLWCRSAALLYDRHEILA